MKDNNNIIPTVTYNASRDKSIIYKENLNRSGIYRWNNKATNKSYVGSSVNLGSRLSKYYSKKAMLAKLKTSRSIIYSALLKHGYENFTLDILEYCEIGVLIEREQYYIDLLKPKYNILKAANSRLGSKHSLKTRALISLKLKGVNHPFFGKTISQEMRMKISVSNKAFWSKVKIKREIKPKTPETLLKLSLRSQGVIVKVLDKKGNLVNTFPTITSAAKYFGVSNSTITCIPNNSIYNNYIFKFEEKDTRVWIYDCNKNLVKMLNNIKEISDVYNIHRNLLNLYIRSGKLYKRGNLYFSKIKPELYKNSESKE